MKKGFLDGYKTYVTSQGHGNAKKWQSAFHKRFSKEQAQAIIEMDCETPYQILGITAEATRAEIKKAFRTLISKWHPDLNQDRIEDAENMSKKIIAAYSLLYSLTNK